MEEYTMFKDRLRIKCIPHCTCEEFDSLISRIEASANEHSVLKGTSLNDTVVLREQMCRMCGNKDPNYFYGDEKAGDTICMGVKGSGCGAIIQESRIDEGAEHRNFADEQDRNHQGPTANRLLTEAVNYRTVLGSTSGKESAELKKLLETSASLEMNYSKIGNDERRTRDGYKNDQKKKAFAEMEEIADALKIHRQVVKRAQEEFAIYRDKKEAVQQYEGIVAACLAYAFREVAIEGGFLLKQDTKFLPRKAEVVNIVSSDPAILIHAGCPIKAWTIEQVQIWLKGVAGDQWSDDADALFKKVNEVIESTSPSSGTEGHGHDHDKRKTSLSVSLSCLGTTTEASRREKFEMLRTGEPPKVTAGQALLKVYLSHGKLPSEMETSEQATVSKHPIKKAIRRRLDSDTRTKDRRDIPLPSPATATASSGLPTSSTMVRSEAVAVTVKIEAVANQVASVTTFVSAYADEAAKNRTNSPLDGNGPSKKPRFVIK